MQGPVKHSKMVYSGTALVNSLFAPMQSAKHLKHVAVPTLRFLDLPGSFSLIFSVIQIRNIYKLLTIRPLLEDRVY